MKFILRRSKIGTGTEMMMMIEVNIRTVFFLHFKRIHETDQNIHNADKMWMLREYC